ncbi:MAG: GtrA family protein [Spirochaetales bacterium]|nr:GtrA family protein [Spirochaetales bacterium]
MNTKKKYILYMIFAAICTGVNIGSQYILKLLLSPVEALQVLVFRQELYFYIQLVAGTFLGFVTKFILDKFIVFKQKYIDMGHTFKQLLVYSLNALLTTAIFWGFELSFKYVFAFKHSELIGGFIGLAIGYTVKFFLDKKLVFTKPGE